MLLVDCCGAAWTADRHYLSMVVSGRRDGVMGAAMPGATSMHLFVIKYSRKPLKTDYNKPVKNSFLLFKNCQNYIVFAKLILIFRASSE